MMDFLCSSTKFIHICFISLFLAPSLPLVSFNLEWIPLPFGAAFYIISSGLIYDAHFWDLIAFHIRHHVSMEINTDRIFSRSFLTPTGKKNPVALNTPLPLLAAHMVKHLTPVCVGVSFVCVWWITEKLPARMLPLIWKQYYTYLVVWNSFNYVIITTIIITSPHWYLLLPLWREKLQQKGPLCPKTVHFPPNKCNFYWCFWLMSLHCHKYKVIWFHCNVKNQYRIWFEIQCKVHKNWR